MIAMRVSPQQRQTSADAMVRALDRIVVGIDFSEMSLATAQWVGRHLGRDAALTLVHVITDPLLPTVSQWRSRQRDVEELVRARTESVRGALRGLAEVMGGANTRIEVRVGDPALQLATYADIVDADLVVVGGNSRFHAVPRHETATTDRLLRHLAQAALVTRNAPTPPKTVLAVLASDVAAPVLDFAHVVAAPSGARVVTLRMSAGRSDASRPAVDRVAPQVTSRSGTRGTVAPSEQARMILDVAREQRAEVIVIGSSAAATGIDDDIARVLARTAACSILVVPHSARMRRDAGVPMAHPVEQSIAMPNEPGLVTTRGWSRR